LVSYNFFNNRSNTLTYADPTLSPYLGSLSAWSMTMASGINPDNTVGTGWGSTSYVNSNASRDAAIATTEYFTIPIFSTGTSTIIINSATGLTVRRGSSGNAPRLFSYVYNYTGNIAGGYTFIATATAQGINVNQNITTELNNTLAANPITITPGATLYMYVIPFSGTGSGANMSFVNTDATSEDFKFSGFIF